MKPYTDPHRTRATPNASAGISSPGTSVCVQHVLSIVLHVHSSRIFAVERRACDPHCGHLLRQRTVRAARRAFISAVAGSRSSSPTSFDFSTSPFDCLDTASSRSSRHRRHAYSRDATTRPCIEPTHLFVISGHVSHSMVMSCRTTTARRLFRRPLAGAPRPQRFRRGRGGVAYELATSLRALIAAMPRSAPAVRVPRREARWRAAAPHPSRDSFAEASRSTNVPLPSQVSMDDQHAPAAALQRSTHSVLCARRSAGHFTNAGLQRGSSRRPLDPWRCARWLPSSW